MYDALGLCARISIHALHEESDKADNSSMTFNSISIHALHEESDPLKIADSYTSGLISIHALHEESDPAARGLG